MQKCILVYDDDLEILTVCRAILEMHNYRVETIANCENIIADIDLIKPDIILMDLWIPKIGGENAISLMLDNPRTRHVPVILFSANAEIEKVCKRTATDGFLKKPFAVTDLLGIVANAIAEIDKD